MAKGWGRLVRAFCAGTIIVGAWSTVGAQAPVQFRADVQVRDSDGKTATAKLFVGATRLRVELPGGGETRPTIIDPKAKMQYTISPRQRAYMESLIGDSGGSVRVPKFAPVNPANPCSNSELQDCKRLGAETVNGFATEKWEYDNADGDRVTAWISTRLRFPIRQTVDDGGSTAEVTNVVEGTQPANLFEIPAGFAKVEDVNAFDALAGLDPALLQRAAEAARGLAAAAEGNGAPARGGTAAPAPGAASSGGSGWADGPGYVVKLTVTVTGARQTRNQDGKVQVRTTATAHHVVSIPLNSGADGIPSVQGPQWYLSPLPGSGRPETESQPLSIADDARIETVTQQTYPCNPDSDARNATTTTVVTQKGEVATTIARSGTQIGGSAIWKLNAAQTTYGLTIQLLLRGQGQGDEVTTTRSVDHCANDRVSNDTKNGKIDAGGFALELKDQPLPRTQGPVRGSTTMPWRFPGSSVDNTDATAAIEWTITRVGAR